MGHPQVDTSAMGRQPFDCLFSIQTLVLQYHARPMDKQHFYFKLIPPRPTFPEDITNEENALMEEHAGYFKRHFDLGNLLLYGPVIAPSGAFGVGILEVADAMEAQRFGENDPSVSAGLTKFEFYPMRVVGARAKS